MFVAKHRNPSRPQAETRCSYADLETTFNDFSNAPFDMGLDFPFYCNLINEVE